MNGTCDEELVVSINGPKAPAVNNTCQVSSYSTKTHPHLAWIGCFGLQMHTTYVITKARKKKQINNNETIMTTNYLKINRPTNDRPTHPFINQPTNQPTINQSMKHGDLEQPVPSRPVLTKELKSILYTGFDAHFCAYCFIYCTGLGTSSYQQLWHLLWDVHWPKWHTQIQHFRCLETWCLILTKN